MSVEQWVHLECRCKHSAIIQIKASRWLYREEIMPRARCTKCGRLGAEHMHITNAPDTPGMGRLVEKPRA